MGYKDFCKNSQNNINKNSEINNKKIEEIYNKYSGKSEDELMGELYDTIKKQKLDGTFDKGNLEGMLQKLSPYLSLEQNNKIKEILNKIN